MGLLILCHEQNWSMEHDIKQLIVHYILRSGKLHNSNLVLTVLVGYKQHVSCMLEAVTTKSVILCLKHF